MLLETALPSWLDVTLGPAGLLVFLLVPVVWGGIKRWWVFGWLYDEVRKERDQYRDLAFKAAEAAEKGTNVAQSLADDRLKDLAGLVDEARKKGLIQ